MRARIFLLLAIIATPAMAFRARPVSDFRFEDRPGIEHCVAAASDGSDYLVLFNARWQVYVQIVSQGVSYGPPVWIGEGEGVAAFWTGSRYVVVWKAYNRGVFLTAVSRRGSLLYAPTLIIPGNGVEANAAWNGRTILVTSGQVGAFATLGGGVFAGWFLLPFAGNIRALIGTDDGFAAATFNNTEIRVYRLDDSARPVLAGGTQVEVPAASTLYFSQGALASDGTNVAVIFTSFTGFFDASMKSVIVGARGEIVQGPRILSHPGGEVLSALWNGSEYVADVRLPSNERTLNQQQIALQRISRAGEPMDTLITVATQQLYGGYDRDIIASNGREYLITGGNSFIRLAIGSTSPTAPAELTNRLLDEQGGLSFARGPQGFLAVWKEWGRDSITVRASRLDREGRNLDGAGIVLDTLQADWSNRIYLSRTSVDSNGGTWLAVWAKDGYIYGRRISSDGVVLDPKPVAIFPGYYPVVRWGINSWLVVDVESPGTTATVTSATVTSDGVVSPANIVDQIGTQLPQRSYFSLISNPALAFDGKQFVLACALPETGDSYPFADAYTSLVTERLGLNGELIPGSRFIRPPERGESGAVSLATNGSQDLIAFRNGTNRLQILLLDHGFFFRTTPLGSLFSGWGSNLEFHGETAVTWNGNEFVVARSSNYGTELIQTSKFGVEGRTEFVSRDPDEQSRGLVFPPSSPVRQPFPPETDPLGLVTRHPAYDSVPRAELLFASDVAALFSRQNPATPVIVSAIGDEDGATVTWKPQDHVLGFMIELRQSDGTDRLLSVASGSASSAHVSYAGLTGTTLHLRAWTADSISPPTLDMQPTAVRRRAVR